MVVRLNLCISFDHHRLPIPIHTAQCHVFRQVQVFHLLLRDLRVRTSHQFRHIRIGESQALHVAHIHIEQELVDIAGGNEFLIDHRANIHALRHRDVINVLDLGNGLKDTQPFSGQAGQDVGTGVLRQGDKGLRILNTFLYQQIRITAVPINDQHVTGYFLRNAIALLLV